MINRKRRADEEAGKEIGKYGERGGGRGGRERERGREREDAAITSEWLRTGARQKETPIPAIRP